jgi:16S rRNA processing protein RimM
LPPPEENEFYWSDLIGLKVVNREGVELGNVDSLMESGANDLLVVKGACEHLIPFVAAFVGKVDLAAGTIEVDWGEDY